MALDMHWVIPNLAQGSYPEDWPAAFRVADVVVLCAMELQARNLKVPPNKLIIRNPQDDDIYRPVGQREAARFFHTADQVVQHVRAGRRVLVTCAAGMNRSGVVTTLALTRLLRMPAHNAIALLRQRRPKMDGLYPLANPMFERFVLNYAKAA
jgi:protein-tyrosine phosphatase